MRERADKLRRRPEVVRYFYLAVSNKMLHTGMSYGGLQYADETHHIQELYVADLVNNTVIHVTEPIATFMVRWREHYNDPAWDYTDEIAKGVSAPNL